MAADAARGPQKARNLALAALLLGACSIGGGPILVRVSQVDPIATSFWRLALALIPIGAVFLRIRGTLQGALPSSLREHAVAAAPGLCLATDLALWQISIHRTSVANATLLVNMAPVFVTAGGWLLLSQRVSGAFLVGLTTSLAGVLVLHGDGWLGGGQLGGDLLALGAAVFYAGYLLLMVRARQRFPTIVIMLWSTLTAAAYTLPIALAFESRLVPATPAGWAIVVGLAWLSHAAGQGLIAYSMAWLPATFSSLTLLIQPVVATALAWRLLGEQLTPLQAMGGVVVIGGILLANRR